MEARAEFSASSSLIDEIRLENQRIHASREAARRRRRRQQVIVAAGIVAGVVALGLVVRQAAQRQRIEGRLEVAQAALASDSPVELERAAEALATNLALAPSHDDSLGLLAMVRVHQFAEGWISEDAAKRAIQEASDANSPDASLARGMMAGLSGDFDQARRTYEAHAENQGSRAVATRNDTAWLRGVAALSRPFDQTLLATALQTVREALDQDPRWTPNRRIAAALAYRAGKPDEALRWIEEGRALHPAHVGLSADEVLLHALLGRELKGTERAAATLLEHPLSSPVDRAYVQLALAAVKFHEGKPTAAETQLDEAWKGLPRWDNHARDVAIDLALQHGGSELVRRWLDGAKLDPQAAAIYDAWQKLAEGDTRGALVALQSAPQDSPRVALLQALALVEQQRWTEAESWLAYAAPSLGDRRDIQVAQALVSLERGDKTQALDDLEALAKAHPNTPGVWTALARAHLEDEDGARFDETIARALEQESGRAEALWLQGKREAARGFADPTWSEKARDAFRRAVDENPHEPRYHVSLGLQLALMGYGPQAEDELRKGTDLETGVADGEALLGLAKLVMQHDMDAKRPVSAEIPSLLARAAATAVNPWWIEIEWARYELAQATQQSIASARLRTTGVLEQMPKNIEARVIQGDAMLAQGDFDAARISLGTGIRRTMRTLDGLLYMGLARVELAAGKKRNAASEAFKGWRKLFHEPALPADLMRAAPFVMRLWTELENPRGARTVARELTLRLPYQAEAWILRAEAEFADEQDEKGCEAALKAAELEPQNARAVGLEGDCRVKQRDFKAARETYDRAAALAEGTSMARDFQKKRRRL